MKSVWLMSSLSRKAGGLHESVRRLAQSVQQVSDCSVNVLALEDEFTAEDATLWHPVATRCCRVVGPRIFGYSPAYRRALAEVNPDLIQLHGLWMYPSVVSLLWHLQTRKPVLVNSHGMLDEWAVRHSQWKKRLASCVYQNAGLRKAACIRALCPAEAKSIRAYGLKNPICLIPNGMDLPADEPSAPAPWADKIEAGRRVLLYLGRIHPKKGLPNLLRAWARTWRSGKANEWRLAIAGWDQNGHEEELKIATRELGIRDSVHFMGPQFGPAKAAAYHHASAFVLPSFSEGLPMVVLEAWSHAKPVLMSPQCNLDEGFEAAAAIRIEPEVPPIADGLLTLISMNQSERDQMGSRGRELVAKKFNWRAIGRQFEQVHTWLLGGGREPDCVVRV